MWRAAPPIAIFDGWEPPTSMSEQSGPFQSRNSRLNPNARWRHTVTGPPEYNSPHLSKTAIGRAAILLNGHSSQTYTGALRYNPGVPRRPSPLLRRRISAFHHHQLLSEKTSAEQSTGTRSVSGSARRSSAAFSICRGRLRRDAGTCAPADLRAGTRESVGCHAGVEGIFCEENAPDVPTYRTSR